MLLLILKDFTSIKLSSGPMKVIRVVQMFPHGCLLSSHLSMNLLYDYVEFDSPLQ